MFTLETEADLIALHTGMVKESLHLEYKASDSADKKDDKKKVEMARDVSSFANADGGQIVYGMKENKDHEPAGLDDGLDPREYPEIWFEQILQQHVTPILTSVRILHVPLSNGRVAVVVSVPASNGDPHQVDGRYYRRHNFNKLIMEHYEVKQAFLKQANPELYLTAETLTPIHQITFNQYSDRSDPVTIVFTIGNRSNSPAMYAVIMLLVGPKLLVTSSGSFSGPFLRPDFNGQTVQYYMKKMSIPHHFPIFKELPFGLNDKSFTVALPRVDLGYRETYPILVEIMCPGFVGRQRWVLQQLNGQAQLTEDAG
jgi:hypothetical protein